MSFSGFEFRLQCDSLEVLGMDLTQSGSLAEMLRTNPGEPLSACTSSSDRDYGFHETHPTEQVRQKNATQLFSEAEKSTLINTFRGAEKTKPKEGGDLLCYGFPSYGQQDPLGLRGL
ncbi:hypothetical protein MMC10_005188 [Thelotrema lepadinum]|nr:hypothetical protein [Thelotrema lepadinum]